MINLKIFDLSKTYVSKQILHLWIRNDTVSNESKPETDRSLFWLIKGPFIREIIHSKGIKT